MQSEVPVEKFHYRDVFDEIIENLNEQQLNELIEEINNQKLLLKCKAERRLKMKAELKQEKAKLLKEMRESVLKQNKPRSNKVDFDSDDDYEVPKKKSVNKK